LAAIYLDGGIEAARTFLRSRFSEEMTSYLAEPTKNWKADLQEMFQKKYRTIPLYKVLAEKGPDHNKVFEVGVFFEEKLLGSGTGSSKKEAEQNAAQKAFFEEMNPR
jgi:ribonuclease-3